MLFHPPRKKKNTIHSLLKVFPLTLNSSVSFCRLTRWQKPPPMYPNSSKHAGTKLICDSAVVCVPLLYNSSRKRSTERCTWHSCYWETHQCKPSYVRWQGRGGAHGAHSVTFPPCHHSFVRSTKFKWISRGFILAVRSFSKAVPVQLQGRIMSRRKNKPVHTQDLSSLACKWKPAPS